MSTWRYVADEPVAAADGLAADEAAMLPYRRRTNPAWPVTLKLYSYRPHCALVGRFQSLADEIDLGLCKRRGYEVGRRPTGGGAIIMGPGQLAVALTSRARPQESPHRALERFARGITAGLGALGLDARFRAKNDVEVGGKKIAGLGLYRDGHGAILFHASVLADLDVGLMLEVLRIPGAKVSDKAVAEIGARVTTISAELGSRLEARDVREAFRRAMAATYDAELRPARLEPREAELAARLAREKYGHPDWIAGRSPVPDAHGSALVKTPLGLTRVYAGLHGGSLKSVLMTGDWNVLPEALPRLEAALKWTRADPEAIRRTTAAALAGTDLEDDAEALAAAVAAAAADARGAAAHLDSLGTSTHLPEADPAGTGQPAGEAGE